MDDISLDCHGARLSAWRVGATSEELTTDRGRPCVVMAHGFGCTKDSGLLPFAERFAAAGADVVLFDYRGFGTSEGGPRQLVDHRRHRQDYRAVVDQVRAMDGVDPERLVLWGSSYSGGHVVAVAAQDPRLAGVISQGAAMDGLAATLEIVRYAGLGQLLRLTGHALRDVGHTLLGRAPHRIPIVGPPGSTAALTSPDSLDGYSSIAGPTFRNALDARSILSILVNRPLRLARRVTVPTMLVIAEHDTIAPPAAVERVGRSVRGRVEKLRLPVGHFDIYLGQPFERSVAAQVAFLRSL